MLAILARLAPFLPACEFAIVAECDFVDGGPDIPETLLRAHLAGEVVFVVGAGLSQNAQLPDFKTLVERVYRHLNLDFPPSVADYAAEKDACDQLQWDRLLGMVDERVGDLTPFRPNHRNKVRQAVSEDTRQRQWRRFGACEPTADRN